MKLTPLFKKYPLWYAEAVKQDWVISDKKKKKKYQWELREVGKPMERGGEALPTLHLIKVLKERDQKQEKK